MNDQEEFYVGWQNQAPPGISSHLRKTVIALVVLSLGLACILALSQHTIGKAVFEWGTIKTFHGLLRTKPYPHLLVNRPGQSAGQSAYYIVAPFKFGLKPESIAALDGKPVTLKGTLIYRGDQTMIEALPDTIRGAPQEPTNRVSPLPPLPPLPSTEVTLTGEIVDSKCYLGVMNPGRLTPHRACAVRCISGGIPPILLVRQKDGPPLHFLLVSKKGKPVNKEVLDMVAEPIEVTGDLVRDGQLSILRADPATYRRVTK